jgi:hypothetical protein
MNLLATEDLIVFSIALMEIAFYALVLVIVELRDIWGITSNI